MNYQKLDAGLAAAVEEEDDREAASFTVFIHTDRVPDGEALRILKGIGVAAGDSQIFTATISSRMIAHLSEQPWVQSIKLSRRLHALKS
jgi:hypothetical protein